MKIFVSPESFREYPSYKDAMKQAGICEVDESLKLGEILVEENDGTKTLIDIREMENG